MMPHDENPVANARDAQAVLARRSALMKALRAGGVAAAGGVSVNAFASRIVTSAGTQCTVSGQASAIVSKAANDMNSAPCAGFAPGSLFTQTSYTVPSAGNFSLAVGNARLEVTDTYVGVQTGALDSTSGVKLAVKGWPEVPGVAIVARARIVDIFGSLDSTPLLYALYRNDDLSYFVAAYLSALLSVAPSGKTRVPFPASDVQRYFNNGTPDLNAVTLYRLVCVG